MRLKSFLLCVLIVLTPNAWAASNTILVMGDSLSAGYGIAIKDGWVALLGKRLKIEGYPHQIVNASISGETTAGGKRRFNALLETNQPKYVILELGANDGLRGQPIKKMKQNLHEMIDSAQSHNAQVLLLGMMIPPNYGRKYTQQFHQAFIDVAAEQDVAIVDFFLAPVALQPRYFQADRAHPTADAQPLLLNHVWPDFEPLILSDHPNKW